MPIPPPPPSPTHSHYIQRMHPQAPIYPLHCRRWRNAKGSVVVAVAWLYIVLIELISDINKPNGAWWTTTPDRPTDHPCRPRRVLCMDRQNLISFGENVYLKWPPTYRRLVGNFSSVVCMDGRAGIAGPQVKHTLEERFNGSMAQYWFVGLAGQET